MKGLVSTIYVRPHLYRTAGVPSPDTRLIKFGGKWAIMSDWITGVEPMSIAAMRDHPDVRRHFAVDAWLGNWDVVGLDADNIVKGPGDQAYRIDPGGSMIFRAQGKPKPFTTEVPELESMRSPSTAPQASKVFAALTNVELKAGAEAVAKVSDSQIDELIRVAGIPTKADAEYSTGSSSAPATVLSKVLKARRDFIIENVLNAEAAAEVTAKELKGLVKLKDESLAKLVSAAKDLKPQSSTTRVVVNDQIFTRELGATKGPAALKALVSHFSTWKGATTNTKGNVLRWAAAEHKGRGPEELQRLAAFWKFAHMGSLEEAFDKGKKRDGPKLVNAMDVSNNMNHAVLHIQRPGIKGNAKAKTVTLYRSLRPDQIKHMGWQAAKVGDIIEFDNPTIFSHTLGAHIFEVGHGVKRTRVEVPLEDVLMSDRVNNTGAHIIGEDEALYVSKKPLQLTVIKA